jgi:hypothetical protein
MNDHRAQRVLCASLAAAAVATFAVRARAEWGYRDGFGYASSSFDLRINAFAQPRFHYLTDGGDGAPESSFRLGLAGGRLRLRVPRRRVEVRVTGGVSDGAGLLLDSYVEVGIGDHLGLRFGYFKVPFDEQTTHAPFWLRLTSRSRDVADLGHWYDLGVSLQGNHLRNAFAWALSMTNGEVPVWENANIDFLYSLRLALRLGPLLDWDRDVDLVIGLGSSWTLEPWAPEPTVDVNRSVFRETFDVTFRYGWLSATAAVLYRLTDPGAYGDLGHDLGYHVELAGALGRVFEVATRVAQVYPGVGDASDLEVGVALNGFGDEGRLRLQIEYAWLPSLRGSEIEAQSHRVVAQVQAFY